ncbi:PREDICTED: carnitine O-acetyltransferase-like isoform X2 [Cyprinodon variegatus]|uniref:Carnitine O-acetyltransferase n=1 Tax=Cyprinodon variegatus TaxID=28743 RepID=A0A3Q2CZ23_CYPVA|nr:PREDICTED: carnitine O-acetyltransferase-like isoform X1 [Cyprinodon variegatus]XP_015252207.1 PREDICTED: carnitine O-acetyltransferase-like isoform X2 [Cyprinodon variegatus]
MLTFCSRSVVGMAKKCAFGRPRHLVKPVSATRVAGRYLTHQKGLPSLPVPPLQQTCERYITALEPIVEAEELSLTRRLVQDFQEAGGVGERLQRGLEKRASRTENWLSQWWVQVAYLEYRLPVVVHSSPGLVLPRMDFRDKDGQIRFASKLIAGALDFKTMIDNETLPVEYLGGKPLCMNQYYEVLSSCRIPGLKRDSVVNHAKSPRPPRHITVVHNFQFFQLDVYQRDGTPLTVDQLCVQLEKICRASQETNSEPVGILTTQHRDVWGKAYVNLIKDKTNKDSVSAIQRSIFTLCLDGVTSEAAGELYRSSAAVQMLHGGGSRGYSGNRWFDKTLQFIVGEDGTCGVNYEHAPAEGPPIVALIDHVVEFTRKPEAPGAPAGSLPVPQRLPFNVTAEIKQDIEEAKLSMNRLAQDLDMRVTVFGHFGKNVPKAHKMSPDAFIQIALQLAYYRKYRRCCATYESASLRMFRLGRTDTIRSASNASAAFVKAFDDPSKQNQEKLDLMEKAVKAHRSYTNMAVGGQAIDRHLLGLKLQAAEEKLPVPAIFKDPSYSKALHYHLSTSQVPSKTDCVMCFGPVVPDGYGVCYNPMEDHINFAVSSFNSCRETDAGSLAAAVEDALLDMRRLLEQTPRSKL